VRAWLIGAVLVAWVLSSAWTVADAHKTRSRVHAIRHLAREQWGEVCDVGTMNVPIVKMALGLGFEAMVSFDDPGADYVPPFTNCVIRMTTMRWSTDELCRDLLHEFGHLHGERHDLVDPFSLMWPGAPNYWPPCDRVRRMVLSARTTHRATGVP
jgi:hypothetical protein